MKVVRLPCWKRHASKPKLVKEKRDPAVWEQNEHARIRRGTLRFRKANGATLNVDGDLLVARYHPAPDKAERCEQQSLLSQDQLEAVLRSVAHKRWHGTIELTQLAIEEPALFWHLCHYVGRSVAQMEGYLVGLGLYSDRPRRHGMKRRV